MLTFYAEEILAIAGIWFSLYYIITICYNEYE